jgi:probable phosphoglycerate mutase
VSQVRRVVVEADGGSRGNPGPAAYGALVKDADTGRVLAEDGTTIGVASNNVAEYRGLIAGLRMALDVAPEADIAVRMDSKLVVEQMSGAWKIKHPDMKPLALEANRLAPFGTTYTWVPREQNKHADRLANEALDGKRSGVTVHADDFGGYVDDRRVGAKVRPNPAESSYDDSAVEGAQEPAARGWSPPGGSTTTLVVVRHGATGLTADKRFSGGLAGSNPGLTDDGRDQVRAVADWLAPIAEGVDVVVTSPVRRTRESAEILADSLDVEVVEEPGFAEMEFGAWDGMTFGEVADLRPGELDAWLGSLDAAPPGGESFREVSTRVLGGLARVLDRYAGRTVVVVSHVTPIKILVSDALQAPLSAVFRMELSTASVSVLSFFGEPGSDDLRASLRLYNAQPPGVAQLLDPQRW